MLPFVLYEATAIGTAAQTFWTIAWVTLGRAPGLPEILAFGGSIGLAIAGLVALLAPKWGYRIGLIAVLAIWPFYVSLAVSERALASRNAYQAVRAIFVPWTRSPVEIWLPPSLLLLATLHLITASFGAARGPGWPRRIFPAEVPEEARRRRARRIKWSLGLSAGGLLLWCGGTYLLIPEFRFELPPGYRGWIEVDVEDPSCAPLPRAGLTRTLALHLDPTRPLARDAYLCTSDSMPAGWLRSKYFYRDARHTELARTGWGGGGMVWGEIATGEERNYLTQIVRRFTGAFIGTEAEFNVSQLPVFEIPNDFRGWVLVTLQRMGCPSSGREKTVRIAVDGQACIVDWLPDDLMRMRFFYQDRRELPYGDPGHGGLIWGETGVVSVAGWRMKQFFVGSEAEYAVSKGLAPIPDAH